MHGRTTRALGLGLTIVAGAGLALAQDAKDSPAAQRIRDRLATVTKELEALRGEKLACPQPRVLQQTAAELRAAYAEELDDTMTAERSRRFSRAYSALGVLPPGYDIRDSVLDTTAATANFNYDRKTGTIDFVKPDESEGSLAGQLFSMICYAHLYARTDLRAFFGQGDDRDDAVLARRFVIEGEAQYLATLRGAKQQGMESSVFDMCDGSARLTRADLAQIHRDQVAQGTLPKDTDGDPIDKLPAYTYHLTTDPSYKGAGLVGKVLRRGGWAAVSELYKRPPTSTAQVLHWKKLEGEREEPIAVELPDVSAQLGAGWKRTIETRLGELGLRCLLEELGTPEKDGNALAKGWRGDRLAAFEKEGARADGSETSCAWLVTWESEAGARRLFEALAPALEKHAPGKVARSLSGKDLLFVVSSSDARESVLKALQANASKH